MYTEVLKIIEGGLSGDKEKVLNYSKVLIKNLSEEGDTKFAKKIETIINEKRGGQLALDSLGTGPVDIESRMEIATASYPTITFNDLILSNSLKSEINEFIVSYKKRDELVRAGVHVENNLLLYGPPGCGKTSIAHLMANLLGLPLLTVRLDGLVSSLLGSTAKNIHKIFEFASRRECVLFLDEFDVIAKLRDDKNELGELKRVVNSLIQNIDMFSNNSVLIAATNHQELLDSAVWRRFNKIISLDYPKEVEIAEIIGMLQNKYEIKEKLSPKEIANLTHILLGKSFSDINTIFNNTVKNCVINDMEFEYCNLLKEIYCYTFHNVSEDQIIEYLLSNEISIRTINSSFGYSIRQIQKISNRIHREKE